MRSRDSITPEKTKSLNIKVWVFEFFTSVWCFIKIYFLFFIFDQEKEKVEAKHEQLKSFIQTYYTAASEEQGRCLDIVSTEFKKLSQCVQEDIKAQAEDVLRREFPKKDDCFYQEQIERIMKNPCEEIAQDEQTIPIYARALLEVQERYVGF